MKGLLVLITVLTLFNILEVKSKHSSMRYKRAYGAKKAIKGQFPYMVSIKHFVPHICGGSIIGPSWILTAGHCLEREPEWLKIQAGTIIQLFKIPILNNVEKTFRHPGYAPTPNQTKNDIGLIKLQNPLNFSETIQPIKLGKFRIDNVIRVLASGWGITDNDDPIRDPKELRYIEMNTVPIGPCQKIHACRHNIVDGTTQICALGNEGQSLCAGDSGAALVDLSNGRQIGVFSGFETCTGVFPTLYTRVEYYIDWINSVTKENFVLE